MAVIVQKVDIAINGRSHYKVAFSIILNRLREDSENNWKRFGGKGFDNAFFCYRFHTKMNKNLYVWMSLQNAHVIEDKKMFMNFHLGRLGKLGLKINGGRDRPCFPGDPGIFITTVKRGSVLDKILGPGDKILKVIYFIL